MFGKSKKCNLINGKLVKNLCLIDGEFDDRIYGAVISKKAQFYVLDEKMKRTKIDVSVENAEEWIEKNKDKIATKKEKKNGMYFFKQLFGMNKEIKDEISNEINEDVK